MKKSSFIWVCISVLLFSCSSKETHLPFWKISKKGQPDSYLVGVTEFLTEEKANLLISDDILKAFNQASTLITYWNLEQSDLTLTKELIELGNNKAIKDSLKDIYQLLKKEISSLPPFRDSIESSRIKPCFFTYDKLNFKDPKLFNIDQFWIKSAMPQLKSLKGLETFQDHYKSLGNSKIDFLKAYITSHSPLSNYPTQLEKIHQKLWEEREFDSITHALDPLDLFFENKQDKERFLSKKYAKWFITIDNILKEQISFVSIDIKFLYGKNNFRDKLLSKGYQIESIDLIE